MWRPVEADSGEAVDWQDSDWPLLIHGAAGSGASFFTVVLAAELVRRGEPVIFACAKSEAVRRLQAELAIRQPTVRGRAVTIKNEAKLEDSQLVTVHFDRPAGLRQAITSIRDWTERFIIVKNIEHTLSPETWPQFKSHRRLVLAGDLGLVNKMIAPDEVKSTIAFSDLPRDWPFQRPKLPTYVGQFRRSDQSEQTVMVAEQRLVA